MDKTGTLTTNRIKFYAMQAADETGDRATLERILGDFGANLTGGNRTLEALCEAFPGQTRQVATSVPFTSEQKWSALSYHEPALSGIYVLGAPEVLIPYVGSVDLFSSQLNEWIDQGLRVLLFAHHPDSPPLYDPQGDPQLPTGLNALCLLCFCDELRPEAAATIGHFAELNIKLKIISGDHPGTVAALSSQVGFASDSRTVSGLDLTNLKADQVATLAEEASIFGRITPKQKENLVGIYRQKGYYVGMIGDGVNDMLSLKGADVGIAMRSGSQATRSVADIVLLEDSFAPLPFAFREGQRIVKGMEDVIRLLLTRTFYVLMLIIASQIVGVAFPVTPKHNSIIALLTVGIPILAIAAWARPSAPPHSVVRATSHFVLPAAFSISVFALIVYLSYLGVTEDVVIARSALTTTMVLCGLVLIPFVEPPTKAWVAGDVLSGDWRPTLLAMGMLILFIVILAVPTLRNFFELTLMPAQDYVFIAIGVVVWAVLLRLIWRVRLFESFLDLRRA
jgi:cation-transporting ATPase E